MYIAAMAHKKTTTMMTTTPRLLNHELPTAAFGVALPHCSNDHKMTISITAEGKTEIFYTGVREVNCVQHNFTCATYANE